MRWYNTKDIRHCYIENVIADIIWMDIQNIITICIYKNRDALIEDYFPVEYSLFNKELKMKDKELQDKDHKIIELERTLEDCLPLAPGDLQGRYDK